MVTASSAPGEAPSAPERQLASGSGVREMPAYEYNAEFPQCSHRLQKCLVSAGTRETISFCNGDEVGAGGEETALQGILL